MDPSGARGRGKQEEEKLDASARRPADWEELPKAPEDMEASHQEKRAKMLAAMREQEDRDRLERKRRREAPEADMQAAFQANAEYEAKKKAEELVDRIEVTSSKFGYSGGDEFKQMTMADEPHLEQERMLRVAKARSAKEQDEKASFEAEQLAVEEGKQQNKAAAGFQAAIQRQRREAEEAEKAKKRARTGVKLAVRKAGGEEQRSTGAAAAAAEPPAAAKAAETASEAKVAAVPPVAATGGLGLGNYDSDEDSDD